MSRPPSKVKRDLQRAMKHRERNAFANVSPENVYTNLEGIYNRVKLENPVNLNRALMYITRKLHEQGHAICFPEPEAVTRLALAAEGIPTNPEELATLINDTFRARNEEISYDEVARDYARTYGRVVFNPNKQFPECYQYTHGIQEPTRIESSTAVIDISDFTSNSTHTDNQDLSPWRIILNRIYQAINYLCIWLW